MKLLTLTLQSQMDGSTMNHSQYLILVSLQHLVICALLICCIQIPRSRRNGTMKKTVIGLLLLWRIRSALMPLAVVLGNRE
jgi:hypothetical protein